MKSVSELVRTKLADPNEYLVVFVPAYNRYMVFRVLSAANLGKEELNYGMFPTLTTTSTKGYDGAGTAPSEAGTLPGRNFTQDGLFFQMPTDDGVPSSSDSDFPQDTEYTNDMWLTDEKYRSLLFHWILQVRPAWLKMDLQIPANTNQGLFQQTVNVDVSRRSTGYTRGQIETVYFPRVKQGVRIGNDINPEVFTSAKFVYREYKIEVPKDPLTIWRILTKQISNGVKWTTWPLLSANQGVANQMAATYGKNWGFPLYGIGDNEREKALAMYQTTIASAKEVGL